MHHRNVLAPRLLVSMIGPVDLYANPALAVYVDDWKDDKGIYATLPEVQLLTLVDCVIRYLAAGVNVIIHCAEGKSRSSYLNVAVHMRVMRYSYDQALGYIRHQHPIAQPNPGFEAQLRRLEAILREVNQ